MCTVSNKIENSRLNSYICPHSFTPLASKTQIPPRCGRGYIKENASVASIRLRGTVMAANRKTRHNNTVTSRQYGRRAIFVPGDVKFQDGDAFGLSKLGGGGFLPLLLRSFNVLLALAYFPIRYTHRTTVVLWNDGLCDIRVLFMHDANQSAWRITPIRFNNVRLSPLIFRPNISGLLRPRVLKPLHYPTRASRNEGSNVGAIEVGLHSTQVPNSCRKWNRIFIFLFSITVHCIWCMPLFDELSQSLKQLSTYA